MYFFSRKGWTADIWCYENGEVCYYISETEFLKQELNFSKNQYGYYEVDDFNELSRQIFENFSYDSYPENFNIADLCREVKSRVLAEEGLDDYDYTRIFALCKKFIEQKSDADSIQIGPCHSKYIRYTTSAMSSLIPEQKNFKDAWGTHHFYQYEFECSVDSIFMKFTLWGSEEVESLIEVFRRINQSYRFTGKLKPNFGYAFPKKTETVHFDRDISEEELFAILEKLYREMMDFERELLDKMKEDC